MCFLQRGLARWMRLTDWYGTFTADEAAKLGVGLALRVEEVDIQPKM